MSGTFATVEKKEIKDGTVLAYKIYQKSHGKLVFQHFKRELWALKQLDINTKQISTEKHIIQLLDNQETFSSYNLIFPYYNLTLQTFYEKTNIHERRKLANNFLKQISKGLSYLHQRGIIHCDLSPSNILVEEASGCMFICDFGCTHSISAKHTEGVQENEEIGTRFYKAPEHLFGSKKYVPATDIWSLGAIFTQLLIGYPIFAGESDIEQISRIVSRLGKPSLEVEKKEMSDYPDISKLVFFVRETDDDEYSDSDSDFDFDDNELANMKAAKRPMQQLLEEEKVFKEDINIIAQILTWSIKDRITAPEINEMSEKRDDGLY